MESTQERIIEFGKIEQIIALFGNIDENVKLIEDQLDVKIVSRGNVVKIVGEEASSEQAYVVMKKLQELINNGDTITTQNVRYIMGLAKDSKEGTINDFPTDVVCVTARGKQLKPKTIGQKKYISAIKGNVLTFGIGPAGTGKTYLAVAMAATAFKNKEVNRIILTRPAVEAGEKLGFLPGDLQTKVDPYLRPLYDSLHDIMGADNFLKLLDRGVIEVAPLAYMRGRTLDDAFIILDEAQNTTPEQMKMFLTRIGFGSKAVITGDVTQIDLPRDKTSGLKEVVKVLKDVDGIEFIFLSEKDVIRHELVQKIIRAYEMFDTDTSKNS